MSSTMLSMAAPPPGSGKPRYAPPSTTVDESDLFAQQLTMYASLGRKEGQKAATAKARTEAEFMALLSAYFSGTDPKDYSAFLPHQMQAPRSAPASFADQKRPITSPTSAKSPELPKILNPRVVSMAASAFKAPSSSPASIPSARQYRVDVPATTYTDLRSQSSGTGSVPNSPHGMFLHAAPELDLDLDQRSSLSSMDDNNQPEDMLTPPSSSAAGVKWNSESMFDVVFQQQSMGMKLGYDPVKKCAVVKECFEGTESKKYAQITSGVAIMSVNGAFCLFILSVERFCLYTGQSLAGISLSKIMSRLREAQRPAVIRFETESP
ncbi:Aste57867_8603 [Aphanomyces stellatus]|uniref:Aste57867_8603 protein n=1 Tax=Aphanomyces stellatus TaxID=120398 RepID=A0A485KKU3_9STRA|nr:hypothetical protein As57867_008571 [Aphanomyces stellatus]VFT85489.1 Aste57867_8603 [Aphanomyces stellatus]